MKAFNSITIHPQVTGEELSREFADGASIGTSPRIPDYRQGKRHLFLGPKHGEILHVCASLDRRYICCSVHVISHISNCPFECTYCFLQNYLTDATLSVVVEPAAILEEIRQKTCLQPWRLFRIGTWELGDSLAVPPLNQAALDLVAGFRTLPNCILKLRTKSAAVAPLLDADHGGRTVVSWSLNPPQVIAKEEIGTASLDKRLRAMEQVSRAGYLLGLHFDPLILFKGWETAYESLVREVFSAIDPAKVIWISMGSLRFNPEMKKKMENNYPASTLTAQEMVLGDDNKLRYVRPMRVKMYRHLFKALEAHGARDCFTYLCMERWNVWEEVFGTYPGSIGHLDYLIAESVWKRFPRLLPSPPDKAKYLALEY